jgi:hypothetical protein
MYSRSLKFEEFLHALLMVAEESREQELEDVISQVIDHGVPEIHVRTTRPMQPILKTASRPDVWRKKHEEEDDVEEKEEEELEEVGGGGSQQEQDPPKASNTPAKTKSKTRK